MTESVLHPEPARRLPINVCLAVYSALLFLLIATYGLDHVPLGNWNLIVSLGIAVVKSGLVVWYFMEARHSSRLVLLAFAAALFMLFVAGLLSMADYVTRA